MNLTLLLLQDAALAAMVAAGFALLFTTPLRVIWVVALLGGLGHALRAALMHAEVGIIPATLAASLFIGLAGIWFARRVHTPPVVFTMPACITMIPGLFAYRTMIGGIKLTDPKLAASQPALVADAASHFMLTASLLFALAVGICVGPLLFRKRSIKSVFRQTF